MLSLRVYARLCTQSRAAYIYVHSGAEWFTIVEAHHRCRIQRIRIICRQSWLRFPSNTVCLVTVSSVERRDGGGGEPFLVFGILVERRDIRSSYHPLRVALNFFHGDSILRGFMLFVIESGSLRYMWNIRKRNRGTCARSTIAIRDVEVHVKGNLERSTRNASYFYIYI